MRASTAPFRPQVITSCLGDGAGLRFLVVANWGGAQTLGVRELKTNWGELVTFAIR